MNRLLSILLICFTCVSLYAQNITITSDQNQPLAFAHIMITCSNGDVTNLQSDLEGKAKIQADFCQNPGPFVLQVSYIGFKPYTDTIRSLQNIEVVLETDNVMLDQVVVTAQYDQSTVDNSVHKVKVITAERIEAQGAVNLKDVLAQEANIRIGQDNILGSSMSMQGVSGQNVKILIDGVPVIGRLDGNVDLSQINMNDIERIEVVEGPLSVNYGTDALAGTINLITKKKQKEKVKLNVNSYYETAGQYNLDGRVGIRLGSNQLSVSGGRNYFDGWNPGDPFIQFPEERLADSSRVSQWNPKEQHFAKAQYYYRKGIVSLRPYAEYFNETVTNKGYPRAPYGETALDEYYHTLRANAGVDFGLKMRKKRVLNIIAAYNHYDRVKNVYFKDLTTLQQTLTETAGDQDSSKFNTFMSRGNYSTQKDSSKLNYEAGYEINYETAEGRRLENSVKEQGDYAFFGSVQWKPIKDLNIKPGVRFAYNTVYNTPVTPSINVMYKKKNWSYRGSYARGFRAPGLKELYYEFVDVNHNIVGNPDLQAEESNNYNLNVLWKQLRGKSLYKIGADVFYNDIYNMISLAQVQNSTEYTYFNVGRFQSTGIRVNGDFMREKFKWTLAGSYIGRRNYSDEIAGSGDYFFSPEVQTSFTYKFPKIKSSISLFYKYNGELSSLQLNADGEVVESTIDDYSMLDLSATKKFWKKRIVWTVGAKNLLNVQNIAVNGTVSGTHSNASGSSPVAWGTTLFTSLKLNLAWK